MSIIIVGIILLIASAFICSVYIDSEQPFYVWDFRGRWDDLISMKNFLYHSVWRDMFRFIGTSIYNDDYNVSSALPMLPFVLLLGESRLAYILSIVLIYLVPTCMLTMLIIRRFVVTPLPLSPAMSRCLLIPLTVIAFLWVPFWDPTLKGYTDIAALVPIVVLYYLFYKGWFTRKNTWLQNTLLGLLLWLPFLLRRWNAYTVITLIVSISIIVVIQFIADKNRQKSTLFNYARNCLIAISVMLACLFLFQYGLVSTIISTSYSDIYDAYQGSFQQHFSDFYGRTGIVTIALALTGIAGGLYYRQLRIITLLPILHAGLYIYLFTKTQLLGTHHFIPVAFSLLLLTSIGIAVLFLIIRNNIFRIIFVTCAAILFAANFACTFFIKTDDCLFCRLSREQKSHPIAYEGYSEVERLTSDLKQFLSDRNAQYSAFASQIVLSDVTLWALSRDLKEVLNETAHVDKVNKFNLKTLLSKYVVVTDSPLLQLPPDCQQVISLPNNAIYSGVGIGKAYKKIAGPYRVTQKENAYIFEKKRDLTKEEIDQFMGQLYQSYPSWNSEYIPLIDQFLFRQQAEHNVEVFYLNEKDFPDKKKESRKESAYVIDSSENPSTWPLITKCDVDTVKDRIIVTPLKKSSFLNLPGRQANEQGTVTVWARIEVPVTTIVHLIYTPDKDYANDLRDYSLVLKKGTNNLKIEFRNCIPGKTYYWAFLFGGFRQQFQFIDFPEATENRN